MRNMEDKIVESVRQDLLERSKRGINKYGTTLCQNNTDNFHQHHYEELLDAALYVKKLQTMRRTELFDFGKFVLEGLDIEDVTIMNLVQKYLEKRVKK